MDSQSTPRHYEHVAAMLFGTPWAITESKLQAMAEVLGLRLQGVIFTPEEIQARVGDGRRSAASTPNGVRVLELHGVISPKANMITNASGGTSAEEFAREMRAAAADPKIKAIVIDIDSPGGNMAGVPELADIVFAARTKKPIYAVANGEEGAASAAYLIGAQVTPGNFYASQSAMVGSIGVITAHIDRSGAEEKAGLKTTIISAGKYKASVSPVEPLTEDGRETLQMLVNGGYALFVEGVARGRGVTAEEVAGGFGQGRVVLAGEAERLGMIDGIATLEEVTALAANPGRRRATTAAMKATTNETSSTKGGTKVDEQEVRTLLGIDDDADIGGAISALQQRAETAKADPEAVTALAEAEKHIATLQGSVARLEAERLVTAALQAGKLAPAQQDYAMKVALRGSEELEEFLKTAAVSVQFGEKGTSAAGESAGVDLTALEPTPSELEIAKQMGTSKLDLMRTKAAAKGIDLPEDFGKEKTSA